MQEHEHTDLSTHPEVPLGAVHLVVVLGEVASDRVKLHLEVVDVVLRDVGAVHDASDLLQLLLHLTELLVERSGCTTDLNVTALLD